MYLCKDSDAGLVSLISSMMFEEKRQQISIEIDGKLAQLPEQFNPQTIFRVHHTLRGGKEQAYEPEMIAIGPYHHDKINLKKMEEYKLMYVRKLLQRRGESSVERYIAALKQLEEDARTCYAEKINLSTDEFVEMMLLDGCFIIEFLRERMPVLMGRWLWERIPRDLLLAENQLPFFVLSEIFDMSTCEDEEKDLTRLAISCLNDWGFPGQDNDHTEASTRLSGEKIPHLLGLLHADWCSSFAKKLVDRNQEPKKDRDKSDICLTVKCCKAKEDLSKLDCIKSATDLAISGVKLMKPPEKCISWLDISFENGKLRIPPLVIQDDTETILRNLIAYEEYMFDTVRDRKFITDYVRFMDCLINTAEDAKKLRHHGLVENWLGDDKVISIMFNEIGNNVIINCPRFCYRKVFSDINNYCKKRRNAWMAHLKENYFGTPWSIISFLAAFALLVLTFLQTVLAILK